MIVLKIQKVGICAGVILPTDLLDRLDLKVGDALVAKPFKNGIKLSRYEEDSARRLKALARSRRKFTNAYRKLGK